jgi:hypothetical protein
MGEVGFIFISANNTVPPLTSTKVNPTDSSVVNSKTQYIICNELPVDLINEITPSPRVPSKEKEMDVNKSEPSFRIPHVTPASSK